MKNLKVGDRVVIKNFKKLGIKEGSNSAFKFKFGFVDAFRDCSNKIAKITEMDGEEILLDIDEGLFSWEREGLNFVSYLEKGDYIKCIGEVLDCTIGKSYEIEYIEDNFDVVIKDDSDELHWITSKFIESNFEYDCSKLDKQMEGITSVVGEVVADKLQTSYIALTPGQITGGVLERALEKIRAKRIYLASPFFNDNELLDMVKVLGTLRNKGLNVFSPYENQNKQLEFASDPWREATFNSDVSNIDSADIVVAIANGNYMDSGTAWEIGYAYANKKPIILVNLNKEPVNLMISDSIHAYIDSIEALEEYDFNKLEKIRYENYIW
ncbi:nucleoside 2-deoxyribosyltransferase [Clostridium perfringens]|uniref:nucleoside 2-deoxyribosyltransferase n=1 Tax=Clostridium perfringens TaxID=1502 RepID=UPI001E392A53|nr:nucleoside 2-deoxyribosyltransferase [Clostridium perfringens]WVL78340.1 nucleoside 2-deoxyribosyltransferase [Clostridium perfringens]